MTIYHILKLFHSGPNAHDPNIINTPVIKEGYDEIVFQDPTILMRNLLTREIPPYTTDEWKHTIDCEYYKSYVRPCINHRSPKGKKFMLSGI